VVLKLDRGGLLKRPPVPEGPKKPGLKKVKQFFNTDEEKTIVFN